MDNNRNSNMVNNLVDVVEFYNVMDINLDKTSWNLKVRIISMWNTRARYLPTVQSCTEVILLDKEGSKIQASVCKDHRLRGEIFTGFVYKISKFKVIPNTRELRCTSHGYRLVFNTHTILTLSGDTSIPREGWSFYDTGYIERCRGIFSHLSGICI